MTQAISLLELNLLVKDTIENQLEPSYWVIAEIAELNLARQGHAYLDLVEKQGNQIIAKIRANIWAYTFRSVSSRFQSLTGQSLKPGMKILAQVTVTFHEIYGISLQVKEIDANFTIGERARIKQEILERLSKEGMMDLNRQLPLPIVPQRIAVISSSTAAGYGDFVNQIYTNRFQYRILHQLFQATLQGTEAARSIIQAIHKVHEVHQKVPFDALVIIRGGGAQLDLDCFDDYALAVAIAQSPIPVITGIGHERDETIADLVAHTKMKTPTATAEFLLSGFQQFEDRIDMLWKQMEKAAAQIWLSEERKLFQLENLLNRQVDEHIRRANQQLLFITKQLKTLVHQNFSIHRIQLSNLLKSLEKSSHQRIKQGFEQLEQLQKDTGRLDPRRYFSLGYTRTEINGMPVHLATPKPEDEMTTYTSHSKILSKITKSEKYGR